MITDEGNIWEVLYFGAALSVQMSCTCFIVMILLWPGVML